MHVGQNRRRHRLVTRQLWLFSFESTYRKTSINPNETEQIENDSHITTCIPTCLIKHPAWLLAKLQCETPRTIYRTCTRPESHVKGYSYIEVNCLCTLSCRIHVLPLSLFHCLKHKTIRIWTFMFEHCILIWTYLLQICTDEMAKNEHAIYKAYFRHIFCLIKYPLLSAIIKFSKKESAFAL